MSFDFTLDKYQELCQVLANSHCVLLTVRNYLEMPDPPAKFAIIRHDVDIRPWKALQMAEIEKKFGIRATYYFRFTRKVFQPYFIRKIADMRHEIGYHYETLDKTKGDYVKAIELFEKELEELRKIAEIKTICMHGNPLTKWDNRDLWTKYDFKNFGIIGEAYLSIDFKDILYVSDSGRQWGSGGKTKDRIIHSSNSNSRAINTLGIKSTDNIIEVLKTEEVRRICLLLHPGRWSSSLLGWVRVLIHDTAVNVAKQILKLRRVSNTRRMASLC